ncbi:MarR family transcriptional regulator [Longibaculum muris]|uniref:MarR family transcriptional regulator n=1 Tax=Longibaculum muris TaxID=1796628 RepID=UPI0012BA0BF7|nr:MarR family transcriptional regulator [Longibaculum muris]
MNAIEVLGLKIEVNDWKYNNHLPLYITNTYTIKKVLINNVYALMLLPNEELPNTPALKKHISRIQNIENLPVFLKLEILSEYRKNNLLTNQIPFIYLDKLIYLPFLGTVLAKTNLNSKKPIEKFTLSTQLLFIWIMYQNTDKYYISEAISKLNFSNMTLTRAYRQLVNSGLFYEAKDGRKIYLTSIYSKKELFEKAKPYLTSQILKTGYINKKILPKRILCGESLLSELSLLTPPRIAEYAVYHNKIDKLLLTNELIDPNEQVKVELWNYDPLLFSKDNETTDIISLVISLFETEDERIEIVLEQLLEKI